MLSTSLASLLTSTNSEECDLISEDMCATLLANVIICDSILWNLFWFALYNGRYINESVTADTGNSAGKF